MVAVADGSATRATRDSAATGRWRRLAVGLAPALIYLLVRQVGVVVLTLLAGATGGSTVDELSSWDGAWFLGLARGGYDGVPPGLTDAFGARAPETALAFFPGYPGLVAALSAVPGVSAVAAALVMSAAAGVCCAYGLVRLGELVPGGSRRGGLILVVLFAASPMGVVLSMTYSESLFCALAVWCLVGMLRGQWVLAGACSAAAGLVRPTAAALVAALGLAALAAVLARRDSWRPWAALVLAPAGLLGYLGFVAARTGRWDGWFALQRAGWDSRFDGGVATLGFTRDVLVAAPSVLEVGTVLVLAGALALLVVCTIAWWRTPAWPLLVYAAAVLAMDLGSNGLMNSKARLLLPAFVLLVPVATGLAQRRPATVAAVLGGVVLVSSWFGAYALVTWRYAV